MTLSKKIISVAVLTAFTSAAFAVSDTETIQINVTKNEFIEITGDVGNSPTVELTDTEVNGTANVSLGGLGVDSNVGGDCTINVTSLNNYQLLHSVTSTALHGANPYTVSWAGATGSEWSPTSTSPETITGCSAAIQGLTMNNPAVVATAAGTYSDTLTVVVTNE